MLLESRTALTPQEYLALERAMEGRSEYLAGEMFAMTGSSRRHNLVVANLVGELRQQLRKRPCELYSNDMRVKIPATGLYTYPDVAVVCGEPVLEDEHFDTLLNPILIIEVLSPSTESYDRGKKFEHYRTLASLQEYLLISQDEPQVEQFLRQDGQHWTFTAVKGPGEAIALPSIECELALAEIYLKVLELPG